MFTLFKFNLIPCNQGCLSLILLGNTIQEHRNYSFYVSDIIARIATFLIVFTFVVSGNY